MYPKPLFHHLEDFKKRLRSRKSAIYLDYDGTLTPIVSSPQNADLSEEMRDLLRKISQHFSLGIISGRDRIDIEERVGLEGIHYVGSHGYDIKLSDGTEKTFQGAASAREEIQSLSPVLQDKFKSLHDILDGVLIEEKNYSISIHYRRVDNEKVLIIQDIIKETLLHYPHLKKTKGKFLFEIQPAMDWNKGKALLWIRDHLNETDSVPIYIGDDATDEDAFLAVKDLGIGIFVGAPHAPSQALYRLDSPKEVQKFLLHLHFIKDLNSI